MKIDIYYKKELIQAVETLRSFFEHLEIDDSQIKCDTCMFWGGGENKCIKWNATPPEDVQKVGCDSWEIFDEIPF